MMSGAFGISYALAEIPHVKPPDDLTRLIRADHPRIFFNADNLESVRALARGAESARYDKLKRSVDTLAGTEALELKDYGTQAAGAAFVYLVEGDERYAVEAKRLVEVSLDFYHDCYAHQKPVNWYANTRINAISAFDWIFNTLDADDRARIGRSFLDAVEQVQPTDTRHYFFPQENWSGPTTGFYGNRSLLWYAGLALYGEGIDERAHWFLADGYRLNLELLAHRRKGAGDDGGSATASMNYAIAAYPWSVFNFFHTYRSATGVNIALDWPHVSYFPGYVYWNMLPGKREFGIGDSYHRDNKLSLSHMYAHLTQIVHFYGATNPHCAAFAKWMMTQVPDGGYWYFQTPFLLTDRYEKLEPLPPAEVMPHARNFENMGQIFFRSGSGEDDSYAVFMSGGVLEQHKHFDNNHFCIYKKGFLALDTGSRPAGQHTQHYYPRTVAHNCILIRMPGEQLPIYVDKGAGGGQRWGAPAPEEEELPVPNDGGQYELIGSRVEAFETGDRYSYVASDATESYDPRKCELALRQLVFLDPDYFVVFDRVTSADPSYKKSWLLHTSGEPLVTGDTFTTTDENGRLYSRTLLPERAELETVGGPGKQFWSDGRNYPMPQGHAVPDSTRLLGQWRVEVSPSTAERETLFLHFIHVGDRGMREMAMSELVRRDGRVGVRFTSGGSTWEVVFGTDGGPSGHVTITDGETVVVDRELARDVLSQSGLFGTK